MALEVAESTHDRRIGAFRRLVSELGELDGVSAVCLDDYHPQTAKSARVSVKVEHSGVDMSLQKTAWNLNANLRSLSQRLRIALNDAVDDGLISRWGMEARPRCIAENRHDQAMYLIDVWSSC